MFNFFKKKQYKSLDLNKLKEALEFLETNPKIPYDPYPSYDSRIYAILDSLGIDDGYREHAEKLKDTPIETMSLENLKTMYTYILRSERFCDGAIAGYVGDGSLTKMAKREIELLSELSRQGNARR